MIFRHNDLTKGFVYIKCVTIQRGKPCMCFSNEAVGKKPSLSKYDAHEVYEGFYRLILAFNMLAIFIAVSFIEFNLSHG